VITADTSVWVDYFNGQQTLQTDALDDLLDDSANEVVLLDVVLMEVLRGFRIDRDLRLARRVLAPLPVRTAGGEAIAVAAAAMYRQLRRVGVTIRSSVDLLIGSWCVVNGCVLLHDDRDFDAMATRHGLLTWKFQ
jgi:predicted nucleic acid-binding protein